MPFLNVTRTSSATRLNVLFASLYYLFGVFYTPPHLAWTEALIVSVTAFHGRVFSSAFLPGTPPKHRERLGGSDRPHL